MKKTILAIALSALSFAASAQLLGTASTDYTRGTSGSWYSNYENRIGLAYDLKGVGIFDASYIYNVNNTNIRSTSQGGEGGFTAKTTAEDFNLLGRVGFGGVAYDYYYVLQGEANYNGFYAQGLPPQIKPFVQLRFRDGTDSAFISQTRAQLGTDIALTKDTTLRVAYGYTWNKIVDTNGVTAALVVGF